MYCTFYSTHSTFKCNNFASPRSSMVDYTGHFMTGTQYFVENSRPTSAKIKTTDILRCKLWTQSKHVKIYDNLRISLNEALFSIMPGARPLLINRSRWLSGRASVSGSGGRGFEPRPRHTKGVKNGTNGYLAWCSAL